MIFNGVPITKWTIILKEFLTRSILSVIYVRNPMNYKLVKNPWSYSYLHRNEVIVTVTRRAHVTSPRPGRSCGSWVRLSSKPWHRRVNRPGSEQSVKDKWSSETKGEEECKNRVLKFRVKYCLFIFHKM